MLKPPQRFRSDKHNVFTEEVNKIELYSLDLVPTYAYGRRSKRFSVQKKRL